MDYLKNKTLAEQTTICTTADLQAWRAHTKQIAKDYGLQAE